MNTHNMMFHHLVIPFRAPCCPFFTHLRSLLTPLIPHRERLTSPLPPTLLSSTHSHPLPALPPSPSVPSWHPPTEQPSQPHRLTANSAGSCRVQSSEWPTSGTASCHKYDCILLVLLHAISTISYVSYCFMSSVLWHASRTV